MHHQLPNEESIAVSISPKGDVYSVNVLIPCNAEQTTCRAQLQSAARQGQPTLPIIMRNVPSGIALLMHIPKEDAGDCSLILHQVPALDRTLDQGQRYQIDLASQIFG